MAVEALGTTELNGFGQVVTAGTVHAKGNYAELIASSSIAAVGICLVIDVAGTEGTKLFDIAVGAASSEVDVISNALLTGRDASGVTSRPLLMVQYPIAIASSSRVSMRVQSSTGGETFRVKGHLLGDITNKWHSMTRATTYGANTSDSGGAQVDPGATAGTKGAYTEITSSLTNNADWVSLHVGTQGNITMRDAGWMFDIATGAAASETVIVPDIHVRTSDDETLLPGIIGPFPVALTSGTRVAVRAQSSTNDATDRLLDVVIVAFDGTTAASGSPSFSAYIK